MKKIFYFIASAIVALGAVACQNDIEEGIDAGQQTEGFSIKVTIDEQTRVALGDFEEGKGRKLTFGEGDVLVVREKQQSGTNYLFQYTKTEGGVYTFTCTDEGVSELVGTKPCVIYLGGLHEQADELTDKGIICNTAKESIEGVGLYANNTMQTSTFGAEDYVINMGAMPLLKFTATEVVTFTSDWDIFFVGNSWASEYTTTTTTGDIYLPITTSGGNDCTVKVTTESGFDKSFTKKLAENTIYNLGLIAPESTEWCVSGGFNSWGETPMYVVGNTLVAYNVTLNADGFQFRGVGGWEKQVGAYQEYGSATPSQPTIGEWYQSKFSTNGYMSNITVTETSKAYDLYLLNDPDLAYFCIVEAGSAAPATPEVPSVDLKWGICGSFTNWGEKDDIAMTFDGENWVATNVTLPANAEFQFRYRASWNIAQKGLSETKAITIGDVTSVSGTQNIKVATAGTYDIYLTEDLGAFAVVSTGAGFPSTDTYKLYVYNYVGWSKVYLWAWDSSTNYTGSSWPGVQLTEKTTIGGYEYFVFTFPVSANDKAVNIILNAGNGLPQTSDFSLGTINKDYYVRNDGATAALIEDPNSPEPAVEKVARKITVTYTGGGDLYCYSWNAGNITGNWPGTKMTKSGNTYTYTYDKSYDGSTVNVIFNNNKGNQTDNITNVTLDKDHSFTLNTNWSYTWSTK